MSPFPQGDSWRSCGWKIRLAQGVCQLRNEGSSAVMGCLIRASIFFLANIFLLGSQLFSKGNPFWCILYLSAPNEGKRAEVLVGALGHPRYPKHSQSSPVRDTAKLGGARQTARALSACWFECCMSSSSDNLKLTPIDLRKIRRKTPRMRITRKGQEKFWMSHPWKCTRPGWIGLWASSLVKSISARGSDAGARPSLRFLPIQIILRFCGNTGRAKYLGKIKKLIYGQV